MEGPEQRVVRPSAHVAQDHRLAQPGVIGMNDDENAGRHRPDAVVDHAHAAQQAAVLLQREGLREAVTIGVGPVHAADIGNEARGVGRRGHLDHGLGAVHELDQHVGAEAAPRRLLLYGWVEPDAYRRAGPLALLKLLVESDHG
jgi:hypothetical protein